MGLRCAMHVQVEICAQNCDASSQAASTVGLRHAGQAPTRNLLVPVGSLLDTDASASAVSWAVQHLCRPHEAVHLVHVIRCLSTPTEVLHASVHLATALDQPCMRSARLSLLRAFLLCTSCSIFSFSSCRDLLYALVLIDAQIYHGGPGNTLSIDERPHREREEMLKAQAAIKNKRGFFPLSSLLLRQIGDRV